MSFRIVNTRISALGHEQIIPAGVEEHVMFLKELSDARRIRTTLTQNIEAAAFPGIPDGTHAVID